MGYDEVRWRQYEAPTPYNKGHLFLTHATGPNIVGPGLVFFKALLIQLLTGLHNPEFVKGLVQELKGNNGHREYHYFWFESTVHVLLHSDIHQDLRVKVRLRYKDDKLPRIISGGSRSDWKEMVYQVLKLEEYWILDRVSLNTILKNLLT